MKQFFLSRFLILLPGILSLLSGWMLQAQTFTDSNLPIVIINTDGGASIPDEPGVLATMKIIYRGPDERNYVSDQTNPAYLDYNGRIDIEIRGQSSQVSPKKCYGFTTLLSDNNTKNNVELLGMPKENDWILNGMVFDSARIRDYICYNLSRKMGNYATRTVYCEVMINNSYMGLYLLQEKIKADDNRVDVIKITSADNYLPGVSGGYITKADKLSAGETPAWTMYTWYGSPVEYIHEMPKPDNVTTQQTNYIHNCFNKLEWAAAGDDISLVDGYPSIIDIPSFIDYMIITELGSNPDAGTYSTYFHKDRNGKLRAGPVWDCDLTFGNDLFFWGYYRSKTTGWRMQDWENDGSSFWKDLFDNSTFRCYISKRFNELNQDNQLLDLDSLEVFIDQTVALTSEGVARDYIRWDIYKSLPDQIEDIKDFLYDRLLWIRNNIGAFSGCNNVYVPPLVITRIMYNPLATDGYPDNEALEFIEISNNGDQAVNLTGIYFRGTGLVYQFPSSSSLAANSSLFLASSSSAFETIYGFEPFDGFTRHLSNSDQDLVLADGFGNVIDQVHYYDDPPWPDGDSSGYYLQLADINLDNNMAENWTASNSSLSALDHFYAGMNLKIYPNPVTDLLRIESKIEILSVSVYDIQGRILEAVIVHSETWESDMKRYAEGTYIIRIYTAGAIINQVIIKK
jgi:hypothetical protein